MWYRTMIRHLPSQLTLTLGSAESVPKTKNGLFLDQTEVDKYMQSYSSSGDVNEVSFNIDLL